MSTLFCDRYYYMTRKWQNVYRLISFYESSNVPSQFILWLYLEQVFLRGPAKRWEGIIS
jgi:hypothetical protein